MPIKEREGLSLSEIGKLNPYFIARLIELEALFDHLVVNNYINPKNIQTGPIVEIGSDCGSGVLALRRKTLAPILIVWSEKRERGVGLDQGIYPQLRTWPQLPPENLLKITSAYFRQSTIDAFFASHPVSWFSLVVIVNARDVRDYDYSHWLKHIGPALCPNGQLLITSDQSINRLNSINVAGWGEKTMSIISDDPRSDLKLPRILPAPTGLIAQLGGLEAVHNLCSCYWERDPFRNIVRSGAYQDSETGSELVANFRDRNFWIFTKK